MASELIFFFFFFFSGGGVGGNSLSVDQSNSAVWIKFIYLEQDYSKNISVKLSSKYLQ